MNRLPILAVLTAAAALASACGGGGGSGSASAAQPSTNAASPAAAPPASGPPTVGAVTSPLGTILVDGSGRAVYLFEADKGATSVCYDACAKAWPPLQATGTLSASGDLKPDLIGTTTRTDGTSQVTYHGHPLYYFIADKVAGDLKGQGINNFGGGWYVVTPAGDKIDKS